MFRAYFRKPSSLSAKEADEVYLFWKDNWQKEFEKQKLNGINTNFSDHFIFSNEILILRSEDEIAGIVLINNFDRRLISVKECSYFEGFPNLPSSKVQALRYLLSNQKFRRGKRSRVGHLLLSLCFDKFLGEDVELLVGMPLKENGVHNLCRKFGMQSLIQSEKVTKHGVGVEYMTLDKSDLNLKLVVETIDLHLQSVEVYCESV
jgi:hypothetical protein